MRLFARHVPSRNRTDTAPLALVREVGGDLESRLTTSLIRFGWYVRPMSEDVETLRLSMADLWAIDLISLERDPCTEVNNLSQLLLTVPLLIVAEEEHLSTCERHLTKLYNIWPASMHLLVKPYSQGELYIMLLWLTSRSARIPTEGSIYELGTLRIDSGGYRVSISGRPVSLTPMEFRILHELAEADGRILTKDGLLEVLHDKDEAYSDNVIEAHVKRLRDKLQAAGLDRGVIRTVRSYGYCLDKELLQSS